MEMGDAAPTREGPPVLGRTLAPLGLRFLAFLVDSLVLGTLGVLSGFVLFDVYAGLGAWGRLLGFCIALAYFASMNSSLGEGRTLGKRLLGIEVVDGQGHYLSPALAGLRFCVLGAPFFLNGFWLKSGGHLLLLAQLVSFVVMGGTGILGYLFLFNRPSHRSLHDMASGSYVTRAGGTGPIGAPPLWPGHMVILAVLGLGLGGILSAVPLLLKFPMLADVLALHDRLEASRDVASVSVMSTVNVTYSNGAKTSASSLVIEARMRHHPADYETQARGLAAQVLADYPAVKSKDLLVVRVVYGYDIGIAHSWIEHSYQRSPGEWASLGTPR